MPKVSDMIESTTPGESDLFYIETDAGDPRKVKLSSLRTASNAAASGNGTPVGSVVPSFLGQEYFDTGASDWYKSTGILNNTQWKKIT
jgi:hypothetical protein